MLACIKSHSYIDLYKHLTSPQQILSFSGIIILKVFTTVIMPKVGGLYLKKTLILLACLFFVLPFPFCAQNQVPILIYHSIGEFTGQGAKELFVTPENFEKQMVYLRDHGFTLLTFENWDRIHEVDKPIFITLDDGYKNNLRVAAIFDKIRTEQFNPKATIFVISDFIGRTNRLSANEIRDLANSGSFSIQSHTATHPDLTKTTNFEKELKGAKERIQEMTGKPVIALAYPFGSVNNQIINETKKYYKFGLTTTPSPYLPQGGKDELYLLPRIYIKYSTTLDGFIKLVESG